MPGLSRSRRKGRSCRAGLLLDVKISGYLGAGDIMRSKQQHRLLLEEVEEECLDTALEEEA